MVETSEPTPPRNPDAGRAFTAAFHTALGETVKLHARPGPTLEIETEHGYDRGFANLTPAEATSLRNGVDEWLARTQPGEPGAEPPAPCEACGAPALGPVRDCEWTRVEGGVRLAIAGDGRVCPRCGAAHASARVHALLDRLAREHAFAADYAARICVVGGRRLGLYLPADLVRHLKLEANTGALLIPIGPDAFVVRVRAAAADRERASRERAPEHDAAAGGA